MKITYIFVTGRIDRLKNSEDFAKEMFYGYDYFENKYNTQIIELHDKKSLINKILKTIDRVVNKLTKLPFNMNNIASLENFKILYNSNQIVISNDRLALSSLPMLILCKLIKKEIKISFFVMGLFDLKKRNLIQKIFSNLLLKVLFKCCSNIIFLGIEEYNYSLNKFAGYSKKLHYLPFMVDVNFWKIDKINNDKDGILFVGNDSNRQFDKVIKIATILEDINFTLVSKHYRINNKKINLPNVKIIDGSWGKQKISDRELGNLYQNSKLVIIPLRESSQPSGQSVALQSMALKTPVMITKTKGLWDKDNFQHLQNIYLIENNSLDNWIRSINELFNNNLLLEKLANNGYDLVNDKYTHNTFNEKLSKILEL